MQKNGFIETIHDYNIHGANTPEELFKKILEY